MNKRTYLMPAALFLTMTLGACGTMDNSNTCDYNRVPYCCDRTAGTGTEIMNCPVPAPAYIEPQAGDDRGDRMFRRAQRK